MSYQQHPLSAAFPPMIEDEYNALVDSITNIGVQNPITIYDGMVLDGWNRYRAATEVGYLCPEVQLAANVDPVDFVLAQNSARRNLTASQRAFAAATCQQWKPVGNPQLKSTFELPSQSEVAAKAHVSVVTLRQAKKVVDGGADEVKEAVRTGATTVEAAAAIARLPKSEQVEALISTKPARFRGRPKKGPKADLIRAELKAAANKSQAEKATGRVTELENEVNALTQRTSEVLARQAELEADNASIARVLDASDQLAEALAEAKKYRDLARGLQDRINSQATQISELKREAARWKKKAEATA